MSRSLSIGLVTVSLFCTGLAAQDLPESPRPAPEHEWLKQFVGVWSTTSQASMGPGQQSFECSGTITSHMLGGYWVVNEMDATVMEAPIRGLQTIGYDSKKEKYVGTWVDSMMNHMWQYEGTVDESGKKLTLEAEGPNHMAGGKLTMFRDAYEFQSPDKIIMTSSMQGEDGEWTTFMTGTATRKSKQATSKAR